MRRWLRIFTALLASCVVVSVAEGRSKQIEVLPVMEEVDEDAVAAVLAEAIRIPTVSRDGSPAPVEAFVAFRALLAERFPRVHAALEVQLLAEHTLLYTWRGSDPSLAPGILLAHQDVVPASPDEWTVPPFEGRIADGYVWGRGALDNKANLIGQLWAVEMLLERGFQPTRTVHLAFGHDEELIGIGAKEVSETVAGPYAWVLDEGGVILADAFPGLDPPAAFVGTAEKGYLTLDLVAKGDGGHSSMPPESTAAGRVAAAVAALEKRPLKPRLTGATADLLDTVGPEVSFPLRTIIGMRWLTGGLLKSVFAGSPSTNAVIRTTAAVTMLAGSDKDNVLPTEASATVNYRLLPGDSVAEIEAYVRRRVGPDIEVRRREASAREPSPVSPADGPAWDALATAIRETFPDVVVAPFLFVGSTDAWHLAARSEATYRFSPVRYAEGDLDRLHGTDERIAVQDLEAVVSFYLRFLQHAASGA